MSNGIKGVAVNGCLSSYENVTSGIPQGSILGPILFVIFINDLSDVIQVIMRMYADGSKTETCKITGPRKSSAKHSLYRKDADFSFQNKSLINE